MEVELARADMALLSNPGPTRVVIPRMQVLTPETTFGETVVRFDGFRRGQSFRDDGVDDTWQCTARYMADEHALMAALISLFKARFVDPDGRILFRTHMGEIGDLNDVEAVVVSKVSTSWQGGQIADVSFQAQAVDWVAGLPG